MESSSKHYQQLQPEDRVTLSSLKQQNYSIRAIARVLQRPASTISRELRRNGSPIFLATRNNNWMQLPMQLPMKLMLVPEKDLEYAVRLLFIEKYF
jgi:hypothetical protein